MSKKGSVLEQLVGKIQEVLKDKEDTLIEVNARLKDRDGIAREFDVLVRTTIQGLPSVIAFECKDYSTSEKKRSVDVQIVDGFNTKCREVPEITQKIIVSTTGFSSNAITKARSLGINLLPIEDVSLDSIVYREVSLLKDASKIGEMWYYQTTDNEIYESQDILNMWDSKTDAKIDTITFINDLFVRSSLYEEQTKLYIKNGKKPINSVLKVKINGAYYIKDENNNKYTLLNISIPIMINFKESSGEVEKAQKITQGVLEVETLTYGFNNNYKFQFIETKSQKKGYFQINGKYVMPDFITEV